MKNLLLSVLLCLSFASCSKKRDLEIKYVGAVWCPSCIAMTDLKRDFKKNNRNIKFSPYDMDSPRDRPQINKLGIQYLPTIVFLVDGVEVHRNVGFTSKKKLDCLRDRHLLSKPILNCDDR